MYPHKVRVSIWCGLRYSSDNFQDQMKRELSYREEMVQQLQIVRGLSLSFSLYIYTHILCASIDSDCKADVDQCSLSLWGGKMEPQKRLNIIKHCNPSENKKTMHWTKKEKRKRKEKWHLHIEILAICVQAFSCKFHTFFFCVQQFSKLLDIKRWNWNRIVLLPKVIFS